MPTPDVGGLEARWHAAAPVAHRRELTRLEIEIYERFQGDNYDALAREYDMTMSGIRKLIKRIKAKLASGPQSDLFE